MGKGKRQRNLKRGPETEIKRGNLGKGVGRIDLTEIEITRKKERRQRNLEIKIERGDLGIEIEKINLEETEITIRKEKERERERQRNLKMVVRKGIAKRKRVERIK